ncbi:acetate--CoA ligase family protein [Pseudonocardia cypriaca]|uniref:Acyl-CoA synthetase (NDP forming) n=1 Tax=Pseudonocardia cypriaca TaxID=882449 RepID=A0A543FS45_9PSEU|nr:acetate--CoA ligase family protein [Pseudonocardia cypriaca]TQM36611.1 acyl-CoA synthetase (NDP forming) [Pseudonocardia cypriaca]
MDELLRPRSIAVIGDSRASARVIEQNRRIGFGGPVRPVHERRAVIAGERAVARVADLADVPDAAFVAVPAPACAGVVAELAAVGCGAAVVYSSGFAETGPDGSARQRELVEAAGAMTLLGPNCYGMINYLDRVLIWPDQHGGVPLRPGERGVAIVSQSSSIAISVTMTDIGLPLGYVVTVGNGAQTSAARAAAAVLADERTSAVGMIVETLADVRGLERLAATARDRGVGVVALVLGRGEQARRAVQTHTASLAGDAAVASAFLRRAGIGEVTSIDALLGALCLLHCGGPLPDARLCSLSSSGGEAALIGDAAMGRDARFPDLTGRQRAGLRAVLGERVALANPLDFHTYIWGDAEAMTAAFDAMVRGPADLTLLFADLPRTDRCADDDWVRAIEAFARACAGAGARGALVAAMAGNLVGPRAAEWVRRGLPVLAPPSVAMEAVQAAATIGRSWAAPLPAPVVGRTGCQHGHLHDARSHEGGHADTGTPRVLDEAEGKALLRRRGVPVPDGEVCTSAAAAVRAAARIAAPVAVKALGTAHKTDERAVRLGLRGARQVRGAAAELLARFPAVLVERMVPGVIAELLIGIEPDPVFGPVLTVGAGGVLTELMRDVAHVMLPADPAEIRSALLGLRCAPLLTGHRGAQGADLDGLVATVGRIVGTALNPILVHTVSLEINPLVVTPSGAWACDALVTVVGEGE